MSRPDLQTIKAIHPLFMIIKIWSIWRNTNSSNRGYHSPFCSKRTSIYFNFLSLMSLRILRHHRELASGEKLQKIKSNTTAQQFILPMWEITRFCYKFWKSYYISHGNNSLKFTIRSMTHQKLSLKHTSVDYSCHRIWSDCYRLSNCIHFCRRMLTVSNFVDITIGRDLS